MFKKGWILPFIILFLFIGIGIFVAVQYFPNYLPHHEPFVSPGTKFRTCAKTPEKVHVHSPSSITDQHYFKSHDCSEILQSSKFSPGTKFSRNNGFVNTVVDCYRGHHNLVIRPDDIWTAIITQFSFYINANAEQFRGKFVNFKGKKKLRVETSGSLTNAPYDLLVKAMSSEIDRNLIDSVMKSWILPNFTTTTEDDIISCGVIFMATMKKYFDYTFGLTCGIPFIFLEGSVEDWQDILRRLDKLKEYKLQRWWMMLDYILKQFVEAKKGNVNGEFWETIVDFYGGSGPDYLSGWISAFCVFDKDGEWIDETKTTPSSIANSTNSDWYWPTISLQQIPPGIANVDVKIDDNGVIHESVMFSGHIAYEILADEKTLRPKIGWALALKNSKGAKKFNQVSD